MGVDDATLKNNKVFMVNQQALIEAAMALEKQETLKSVLLFQCLDQLEDIHRKLAVILENGAACQARNAFLSLFMTSDEWGALLTDTQLQAWEEGTG